MEILQFIFSSLWVYLGVVLMLLIVTNTAKRVMAKVSNEFNKLIDIFRKTK